jgi:hypothetical protein
MIFLAVADAGIDSVIRRNAERIAQSENFSWIRKLGPKIIRN